jgi:hypothetical protein
MVEALSPPPPLSLSSALLAALARTHRVAFVGSCVFPSLPSPIVSWFRASFVVFGRSGVVADFHAIPAVAMQLHFSLRVPRRRRKRRPRLLSTMVGHGLRLQVRDDGVGAVYVAFDLLETAWKDSFLVQIAAPVRAKATYCRVFQSFINGQRHVGRLLMSAQWIRD